MLVQITIFIVISYLVGAIPTAYLISKRVKGIDIRKEGSGNAGASNVFRVVGKSWGIITLLIDILKGALPVLIALKTITINPKLISLLIGIAAICGHNWTCFLNFKGGKGVATTAGVFAALFPKVILCALSVWIIVVIISKYISMASIISALSLPIFLTLFYHNEDFFLIYIIISSLLASLTIFMHKSNIQRLMSKSEHKLFS